MHRAMIRGGAIIHMQCRKCGVGVQTESKLCADCGSNKIHHRMVYKEIQARRTFGKLRINLLQSIKNVKLSLRHCTNNNNNNEDLM